MNKQSKALINEIYRLVGANTLQVQNLHNDVKHLESLVRDLHIDVLERPAEKKVVLMKTAPFGASVSEVVQEYENGKTLQEIREILQQIRESMYEPRSASTPGDRLRNLILAYFSLPLDERTFLYRYAKNPEQRGVMLGRYYMEHDLHNFGMNEDFLKVLATLPQECIM